MDLKNNTILITGGTSGIGFELAKELHALGNTVIVTGRSQAKLHSAHRMLPGLHTVQSDAGDPAAIEALFAKVTGDFPSLNILINNAGIMRKIDLNDESKGFENLAREIEINLTGPVQMAGRFLPHLRKQDRAAIVNVSSGLAFVPFPISPVYSATKAGLHSFTQSLRIQLKNTRVKVFELAPPGTETPLFYGDFSESDLEGVKPMPVADLVKHALDGLRKDVLEIRPGLSNVLMMMSRVAPQFILKQLSKSAENMLARAGH